MPICLQKIPTPQGTKRAVQDLLKLVGLNPEHYNRYPHESPAGNASAPGSPARWLVVADEPVSALDVSIQTQVVNLLEDLQSELNLTYLFIAHDLSVVRHISDRVAVMYLGKVVEVADRNELYAHPRHPYTVALMSAVPMPDTDRRDRARRERVLLSGDVPSPIDPPSGCRFRPRCWKAQEVCATDTPQLTTPPGDAVTHQVACRFPVADDDQVTGGRPQRRGTESAEIA